MPDAHERDGFLEPDPGVSAVAVPQPKDVKVNVVEAIGALLGVTNATADAYQQLLSGLEQFIKKSGGNAEAFSELSSEGVKGNSVIGVGIGSTEDVESPGSKPGGGCVHLYISDAAAKESALKMASDLYGAPSLLSNECCVRVIHSGSIELCENNFRLPRAPGGISVGHRDIRAGTLGCLCRGRGGVRRNRLMALSCNHVLANTNAGVTGDPIYQPGPGDLARVDANIIGYLEHFVQLEFAGQTNYVDCATAWAWPDRVRPELMDVQNGATQYLQISSNTTMPIVGMRVGKIGRTTQLRHGTIFSIGTTVAVLMPNGRVAGFANQFSIQHSGSPFASGGDSGSLVWEDAALRRPVGLLFACASQFSFANPIQTVLNELDVDLYV